MRSLPRNARSVKQMCVVYHAFTRLADETISSLDSDQFPVVPRSALAGFCGR